MLGPPSNCRNSSCAGMDLSPKLLSALPGSAEKREARSGQPAGILQYNSLGFRNLSGWRESNPRLEQRIKEDDAIRFQRRHEEAVESVMRASLAFILYSLAVTMALFHRHRAACALRLIGPCRSPASQCLDRSFGLRVIGCIDPWEVRISRQRVLPPDR